jgi:hypothetical protein
MTTQHFELNIEDVERMLRFGMHRRYIAAYYQISIKQLEHFMSEGVLPEKVLCHRDRWTDHDKDMLQVMARTGASKSLMARYFKVSRQRIDEMLEHLGVTPCTLNPSEN